MKVIQGSIVLLGLCLTLLVSVALSQSFVQQSRRLLADTEITDRGAVLLGNDILVATNNGVVRFNRQDNSVVGTVTLLDGEARPTTVAIREGKGYFTTTHNNIVRVVKFDLSTLQREETVQLYPHEVNPSVAVWDTTNGNLFLGLDTPQAQVVRLETSPLRRVASILLQDTEKNIKHGVVVERMAYFSCGSGVIAKVNLANFQREESITIAAASQTNLGAISHNEGNLFVASANGLIYYGARTGAALLNNATIGSATFSSFAHNGNFLYATAQGNPTVVQKITVSTWASENVTLDSAEGTAKAILINENVGYVVTQNPTGKVVRIAATGAAGAPTRTAFNFLNVGINNVRRSVYHTGQEVFYYISTSTGRIARVRRSDFSVLNIHDTVATYRGRAISYNGDNLFVGFTNTGATASFLLRVSTTGGQMNTTETLNLPAELNPVSIVFSDNTYVYVGGGTTAGKIYRYPQNDLRDAVATKLELLKDGNEQNFVSATVDQGVAYILTQRNGAESQPSLLKVRLVDFVRYSVPTNALLDNDADVRDLDVSGGNIYVVSRLRAGNFVRLIRLDSQDFNRTTYTVPGVTDDVQSIKVHGDLIWITSASDPAIIRRFSAVGAFDSYNDMLAYSASGPHPKAGGIFTKLIFQGAFGYFASHDSPSHAFAVSTCRIGFIFESGNCNACPAGTFSSNNKCEPCPAGKYCPGNSQQTIDCAAGTYSNVTSATSNSTCTPCAAGSYSTTAGSTQCTLCAAGRFSQVVGATSADVCTQCFAGSSSLAGGTWCYYCPLGTANNVVGGQCTPCAAGTYANSIGARICQACPAGHINTGTGNTNCTACPVGTRKTAATVCSDCPVGTYNPYPGFTDCLDCPPGQFNNRTGQTTCDKCPPGFSSGVGNGAEGQTYCSACQPGTYATTEGTDRCIACPAGSFAANHSSSECELCPPGFSQPTIAQAGCNPCGVGRYTNKYGSTQCLECPTGTFSDAIHAESCTPCPAGQFQDNTGERRCKICGGGTYSNNVGSVSCTNCPTGYIAPKPGATSCMICPAGHFPQNRLECRPCGKGEYNPSAGRGNCLTCPAGTFANSLGSTSCTQCPAGTSSTAGSSFCTPCEPGNYSPEPGRSTCIPCPTGHFQATEGATSCQPCPAGSEASNSGTNCALCAPGSHNPNAGSSCFQCQPGTFQPQAGQLNCQQCPRGYSTNSNVGATFCSLCPVNTFAEITGTPVCRPCEEGTFANNQGSTSCEKCPAGHYVRIAGGTRRCEPCGPGSFNPTPGSHTCQTCPPGTYATLQGSTECTKCPAGTSSSNSGRTSISQCTLCPTGQYSAEGASGCRACPMGSVSYPANGGGVTCKWCPPGFFSNQVDTNSGVLTCLPCPAGTFAPNAGSHNQKFVAAGTDGNGPRQDVNSNTYEASCFLCPPGTHAPKEGSSTCEPCPISGYSDRNGSALCTPCPGNSHTGTAGATSHKECQSSCSAGFVPNRNQTTPGSACVPCPSGTRYDTSTGRCETCPAGTFQNLEAQFECKTCENSTVVGAKVCTICQNVTDAEGNVREVCTTSAAHGLIYSSFIIAMAVLVALLAAFMH